MRLASQVDPEIGLPEKLNARFSKPGFDQEVTLKIAGIGADTASVPSKFLVPRDAATRYFSMSS